MASPFNAEAVKFTFDRLLGDEGGKGLQRSNYTSITKVAGSSTTTPSICISAPDPVLLTKLAGYGDDRASPKYVSKTPRSFNLNPARHRPVCSSPYDPKVSLKLKPSGTSGATR